MVNEADAELAHQVKRSLNTNRSGFQRIDVQVDAGAVRLTGLVRSYFLRQVAVSITKQVSGVRQVLDELAVDCNEGAHCTH
ncbi:BON domain-containing protein [Anatilimnocola aggregata]